MPSDAATVVSAMMTMTVMKAGRTPGPPGPRLLQRHSPRLRHQHLLRFPHGRHQRPLQLRRQLPRLLQHPPRRPRPLPRLRQLLLQQPRPLPRLRQLPLLGPLPPRKSIRRTVPSANGSATPTQPIKRNCKNWAASKCPENRISLSKNPAAAGFSHFEARISAGRKATTRVSQLRAGHSHRQCVSHRSSGQPGDA